MIFNAKWGTIFLILAGSLGIISCSADAPRSTPSPTTDNVSAPPAAEPTDIPPTPDLSVNNASQAAASEGKTSVGAILRGQQAYFLGTMTFSKDLGSLGVGVPLESDRYRIVIETANDEQAIVTATAKVDDLPSLTGAVFAKDEFTQAILCTTPEPARQPPSPPTFKSDGTTECATGSIPVE
ncbi:MAG: hypothetical protein F6J87_04750 [Spirulina sp. SIO3F2]|nr:hypothetical protein [Spirulina sp. SIO3F2]